MKRTTISMPVDLAHALEREARRLGTSASAVAREAIAQRLRVGPGKASELPIARLGRSGEGDTASGAEELLGREWRRDRDR